MNCKVCGKVFFNCCSVSDTCKECEKKKAEEKRV